MIESVINSAGAFQVNEKNLVRLIYNTSLEMFPVALHIEIPTVAILFHFCCSPVSGQQKYTVSSGYKLD